MIVHGPLTTGGHRLMGSHQCHKLTSRTPSSPPCLKTVPCLDCCLEKIFWHQRCKMGSSTYFKVPSSFIPWLPKTSIRRRISEKTLTHQISECQRPYPCLAKLVHQSISNLLTCLSPELVSTAGMNRRGSSSPWHTPFKM